MDGDHTSEGAFLDGLLSWDLLKPGGVMIFDDYDGYGVKLGVDAFVKMRKSAGNLRVLYGVNQFMIQKLGGGEEDACRRESS